jgi:hypothetical protein
MPSEYPKTLTTNDGLMVYFTCEAEEIAAYKAAPYLYHEKPDCIKDEIIQPAIVEKLMDEVVAPTPVPIEQLEQVQPVKYRGWPKGKKRG